MQKEVEEEDYETKSDNEKRKEEKKSDFFIKFDERNPKEKQRVSQQIGFKFSGKEKRRKGIRLDQNIETQQLNDDGDSIVHETDDHDISY